MGSVNRLLILLTSGTLFLITSATAQPTLEMVDSLMEVAMRKFMVAGAAVGVVKDGKVVHVKGYGVKSIESKSPVDKNTNFGIASNSKAFTTTALAILVEEGKLKWTDKVKEIIPEFTMYDPYVTENFNIQDLLTHRSGLGLGIGDLMLFPDGADFTIDDLLQSFQYFEPVSAFRTKFDYDNLLYLVAGEVIQRVSGMSWEDFVSTRIFEPLGMDQTAASIDQVRNKGNLASPHSTTTGDLVILPDFAPMINGAAGGILGNVDDLCQWMLLHLNHGKYGSALEDELFSAGSQKEMWKIHTVLNANTNPRYNSHFSGYGLGWNLSDVRGNMQVHHTGGLPGMLSKTVMIPDLDLGVVVLTNTSDDGAGLFSSVSQAILDTYMGLEPMDWIGIYSASMQNRQKEGDAVLQKVWEEVETVDASRVNVEDFIGVYEDRWFGEMEVFMNEGRLWMKSHRSPKLHGPMYFYKANTFAVKWDYQEMNCDAFAMFNLDEQGVPQSLKMKGISPNIDFSFDFQDLDLVRVE